MKKILTIILSMLLLSSCQAKEYTMYEKISLTAGFDTFLQIQITTESQEAFDSEYEKLKALSVKERLELVTSEME